MVKPATIIVDVTQYLMKIDSIQKAKGVFIKAWDEIPEIIGSTFHALIGIGMGCYGLYKIGPMDHHTKRFKNNYVVYRPDDPRAAGIKAEDPRAAGIKEDDPRAAGIKEDDPRAAGIKEDDPRAAGIKEDKHCKE